MADFAISSSPAVQAQLDRLWSLSPGADILGLERITRLLARVGNPELHLPPVFHVAGTNGKGSTCAFLRAALEASGKRVHVYSSPHLVRFNERIRLAGTLIEDDALAALLAEVLDRGEDIGASFFEVTTAAAFMAFARVPADACVIEVGLGGRLDATNVIEQPCVTGIAALGIDHQAFLGETLDAIAAEKAGIAKAGVPLITLDYPGQIAATIERAATGAGTRVMARGRDWTSSVVDDSLRYHDVHGSVHTALPSLAGPHQAENFALATAMLRHQSAVPISHAAFDVAAREARWPARMQRLGAGPLLARLPPGSAIWLDGAHNPSAAIPVARALIDMAPAGPRRLILGMLDNKDAEGVIAALAPVIESLVGVPVPGHAHHPPARLVNIAARHGIASTTASGLLEAVDLSRISEQDPSTVLIAGSLYLAGHALALNEEKID